MPAEIHAAAPQKIAAAIARASAATGADFDYLMKTAMRESSFRPDAKAATSSAAGLFQFIEQTWLGAVKTYGARHGLADEAAAVTRDGAGRFRVDDPARRAAILDLRFNAEAASALAGELANENAAALEQRLGRTARAGDLYAAHFLGPVGAAKLLRAAASATAADILPAAAKANPHVFFDGDRPRTVGEVTASIARSMGEAVGEFKDRVTLPFTDKSSGPTQDTDRAAAQTTAPATLRPVETAAPAMFASAPAKLSMMAISVLQALDPTRLTQARDDRR